MAFKKRVKQAPLNEEYGSISVWQQKFYELSPQGSGSGLVSFILHRWMEFGFKRRDHVKSVLEVGAGSGQHLGFVRHSFHRWILSDISDECCTALSDRLSELPKGVEVMNLDPQKLQLERIGAKVDRLVATCVLIHLSRPEEALLSWRSVVNEGGSLTIYIPNDDGLATRTLRRLTTARWARRAGFHGYDAYYLARDHALSPVKLETLIHFVFRDDRVVVRRFPFRWSPRALCLFTVYDITLKQPGDGPTSLCPGRTHMFQGVKSPERLADSGQESDSPFKYLGDELELFATARNWRAYWQHRVRSHLRGSVLEVGAGIGTVTRDLVVDATRWLAIEPDPSSAAQVQSLLRTHEGLEVVIGTIRDLPLGENFDTALYVDVLEHIENDAEELKRVAERLRPGGRLIVLVPARPQLYSAFDRAVGHYRRYTAGSLDALRPPGFEVLQAESLDVFGLLVSALNKGALHQERPTRLQILFWDRILVPMSRLIDPILRRRVGKSLLVVWVKRIPAEPSIV